MIESQNESINKGLLDKSGCDSCNRRSHCPLFNLGSNFIQGFNSAMIEKVLVHRGQEVFNQGSKKEGLFGVKSGFFKSYTIDEEGEMQIVGFHMPGDLIGIKSNSNPYYSYYVKALDTGSTCKLPFTTLEQYSIQGSKVTTALMNILNSEIEKKQDLIFALSKMDAKRRFATFLLNYAQRMEKSGFTNDNLRLCMNRADIANYLGLSVETVSRLFSSFSDANLVKVNRRLVQIDDRDTLCNIAHIQASPKFHLAHTL